MHPKTEKCVSLKDTSFILSGKRCKNQVIELKKTGIYFKTSLPPVAVVVFEGIPHTPLVHPPPPPKMQLICSLKFCISIVFNFHGTAVIPRRSMKNKGYANFGGHAQIRCIILIMGDVQLAYCGVNHEMA